MHRLRLWSFSVGLGEVAGVEGELDDVSGEGCGVAGAVLAAFYDDGDGDASAGGVGGETCKPGVVGLLRGAGLAVDFYALFRKAAMSEFLVSCSAGLAYDGAHAFIDDV